LHLRVLFKPQFGGALLGLTDHFSAPWDAEDQFFNVFQMELPGEPHALAADGWHDLEFRWDCGKRECRVAVDGGAPRTLFQRRTPQSQGLCYLRLRSTAVTDSAGMLVGSVAVEVSRSR
jgi:hypothetical protein